MGTLRRNLPTSSAMFVAGPTSPSKIPSRVPLGSMKHGPNSPERRGAAPEPSYDSNTVRKMGPPAKAPPPKMRDLFIPPNATPMSAPDSENWRCESVASSNGSGPIRSITPEDVYSDRREHMSYVPSSALLSQNHTPQNLRDLQPGPDFDPRYQSQHDRYVPHIDSRQISTTSTASQAISGSENWETYDDASEPELDASEAYYAKLKATKGKRYTPEGCYPSPRPGQSKKLKALHGGQTLVEEGGKFVPAGSDAGWTDEDAF